MQTRSDYCFLPHAHSLLTNTAPPHYRIEAKNVSVSVVMTLAQTAIENHRQVRSGPERVNHRASWLVTRTLSDLNTLLSACISAQIAIQTWRFGVIVPDDWKFEVWSFYLNCERNTDRVRYLEHKS